MGKIHATEVQNVSPITRLERYQALYDEINAQRRKLLNADSIPSASTVVLTELLQFVNKSACDSNLSDVASLLANVASILNDVFSYTKTRADVLVAIDFVLEEVDKIINLEYQQEEAAKNQAVEQLKVQLQHAFREYEENAETFAKIILANGLKFQGVVLKYTPGKPVTPEVLL